jgi:cytochrome c oxidase cbb3-type subunit II
MNKSLSLVSGLLTTVLLSLFGLVLVPNWHFQELKPVVDADGVSHPRRPDFAALEGCRVYIPEGCIYCHSQQVRAAGFGADIDRNWGSRRSLARDYIFDRPH